MFEERDMQGAGMSEERTMRLKRQRATEMFKFKGKLKWATLIRGIFSGRNVCSWGHLKRKVRLHTLKND